MKPSRDPFLVSIKKRERFCEFYNEEFSSSDIISNFARSLEEKFD